ncbi:hypothetical protein [Ruegeria arenilitoris]|uniref:hypothetical protein n=1 Tax=Ruegeria arenilitoris TaxID=1173585 RepID=UPI001481853E|nr:hypothetical protein [Ruegeria arenilitoris]
MSEDSGPAEFAAALEVVDRLSIETGWVPKSKIVAALNLLPGKEDAGGVIEGLIFLGDVHSTLDSCGDIMLQPAVRAAEQRDRIDRQVVLQAIWRVGSGGPARRSRVNSVLRHDRRLSDAGKDALGALINDGTVRMEREKPNGKRGKRAWILIPPPARPDAVAWEPAARTLVRKLDRLIRQIEGTKEQEFERKLRGVRATVLEQIGMTQQDRSGDRRDRVPKTKPGAPQSTVVQFSPKAIRK